MDCRRVNKLLPAYLEDALPVRATQEVARHLTACARCREERRALEVALSALDRVGRRVPSIDLWTSFAQRVAAEQTAAPAVVRRRPNWFGRGLAGAAAGAVATAAFAFALLSSPAPYPFPGMMVSVPTPEQTAPVTSRQNGGSALRGGAEAGFAPVWSPERMNAFTPHVAPPSPSLRGVAPRIMSSALPPQPPLKTIDRTHGPMRPGPSEVRLAEAADALMDAPECAARAEVAREVIALAEQMVRVQQEPGDTQESEDSSEGPS